MKKAIIFTRLPSLFLPFSIAVSAPNKKISGVVISATDAFTKARNKLHIIACHYKLYTGEKITTTSTG